VLSCCYCWSWSWCLRSAVAISGAHAVVGCKVGCVVDAMVVGIAFGFGRFAFGSSIFLIWS